MASGTQGFRHKIESGYPLKSFRFFKTKRVSTGKLMITTPILVKTAATISSMLLVLENNKLLDHSTLNVWKKVTSFNLIRDGSVIYGNNDESIRRVRTFKDGKLKIVGNGLFEHDEKGIPILRDVRNCWADFSLLQALFVREHNGMNITLILMMRSSIDMPDWDEDQLKFKDMFGYVCGLILSGLVGFRKPKDHGVPYSLTKQFFSIYKMHSLLPNKFILRNIKSTTPKYECPLVSGTITLWNYLSSMRNLVPHDINGEEIPHPVDMATLEIYGNRDRGVAQYNEF
ncbi:hem peroxidase [Theobroma cacao]|nr:hem peroxidase [Theobroma cacao]